VKSIISATKGVPKHIMDEIRKALKQINIKAFYEKWKVLQLKEDKSLTLTEETHGLATNVFLTCKKKQSVVKRSQQDVMQRQKNVICCYDVNH